MKAHNLFFALGAISAFIGVALGAFGAHGLRAHVSEDMLRVFEIGVRYQMYHALALFVVAWATTRWQSPLVNASGILFCIGTLLFCGSLYLMAWTGARWLGAVTPIGGLAFLAAWACLFLTARRL